MPECFFSAMKYSRILVRIPNWIGDAIVSLSALQAIKNRHSEISITLLGPAAITDLLSEYAGFSVYRPKKGESQKRFDAGLCFPLSFRSAFELWKTPCHIRTGFGHEGRSLFLNRRLDYTLWKNRHEHQVTYYQEIVSSLFEDLSFSPPLLTVSPKRRDDVMNQWAESYSPDDLLLAVNPGAFFGSAKTWPSTYFITLISRLMVDFPSLRVLLFSGEKDREKADILKKTLPPERVLPLQGKTSLSESLAILSGCHYLLTNDSGMMHMGAALGLPGTAFFGPTDPVATGPLGGGIRIAIHPVSCSPCLLRECPIDHRCMTGLTPETVYDPIAKDLHRVMSKRRMSPNGQTESFPSEKADSL